MKPTKICSIDSCGNDVLARGFCNSHYLRWHRHGDPLAGGAPKVRDLAQKFTANTTREGDCLIWTGGAKSSGYGKIFANGKSTPAHVYVWTEANGAVPDGLEVDHRCHNRLCCELTHLRLVTRKQNSENHQGALVTSTTGARGVWWNKQANAYQVEVKHHKKKHYGGRYKTIEEAEVAAIELRNRLFTHNDHDRKAAA